MKNMIIIGPLSAVLTVGIANFLILSDYVNSSIGIAFTVAAVWCIAYSIGILNAFFMD